MTDLKDTNLAGIITIAGILSALYLFLKYFIPFIQNLAAELGAIGIIIAGFIVYWLLSKKEVK